MALGLREGARWLVAGWLLALSSGSGQTYFIAVFAGHIRADLGISEGVFGSLYSAGTLASAVLLMSVGRIADRPRLRWLAVGTLLALAGVMVALAHAQTAVHLVLAFFGLRFFGQGMLIHLSMTGVARWFSGNRGKAVSIAALGNPSGEATLPLLAVAAVAAFGWRETWMIGAALLALISVPLMMVLLAREPAPAEPPAPADAGGEPLPPSGRARHFTRAEVLRDRLFYLLQPGVLAPPFVLTAIFISQASLAAAKGWTASTFALALPAYAAMTVVAGLVAGAVVDRFGARRVLPVYLLPMGLAALMIGRMEGGALLPLAMGLAGITAGGANTLLGALWAELYGTRHLGAVRSLATFGLVVASALSPALVGLLADAGIPVETSITALGAYALAASLAMALVAARHMPR